MEVNWKCSACKKKNKPEVLRCSQCRKRRSADAEEVKVEHGAEEVAKAWQEHTDPASSQLYYCNVITGVTQWERPSELGPAPYATGWYGRGTRNNTQELIDQNQMWLNRPARKQQEKILSQQGIEEVTSEYNIWHGARYSDYGPAGGGRGGGGGGRDRAPARCRPGEDAGWTKADRMTSGRGCFCLHFARGLCVRGQDCVYYHRIPTPEDDRSLDRAHDCFGRERHREHRDDRGGVGSFRDPSRTLYVGGLTKAKYTDDDTLTERLHHHFGEWGEVESINFIPRLLIAFVRYRLRSACEFAREAMAGQALDARELLNVRWACEDPNPRAQAANAASDLAAVRATLRQQGVTQEGEGEGGVLPHNHNAAAAAAVPFDYPAGYALPPPAPAGNHLKKRRRTAGEGGSSVDLEDEGQQAAMMPLAPVVAASILSPALYPDTDHQYPAGCVLGLDDKCSAAIDNNDNNT